MGCDVHDVFIDLVKVHDSMRHGIVSLSLKKMGVLERHTRWIKKSCGDFEVMFKMEREDVGIRHRCGFWQGDDLAPALFIRVMQLDAEGIMKNLKSTGADVQKNKT